MVDKATFEAQAQIIADAINIMWADEETRSPHHPLRILDNMFNTPDGETWAVRQGYIDAVYDDGGFPARLQQTAGTVIQQPLDLGGGTIIEAVGNAVGQKALLQFFGDFAPGNTVSFDYDIGAGVVPVSAVLTGSGNYAALAGALAQALGASDPTILASANGGRLYASVVAPTVTITISNLTVV